MTVYRCVYVSLARLHPRDEERQLAQLVDHALKANALLNLTGALMYDGKRFAQLLEGPEGAAIPLANRIAVDTRHCQAVFLEQQLVNRRLFDSFSMAYKGNSLFVERTIERPLFRDDRRSNTALRQLIQMMQDFAS